MTNTVKLANEPRWIRQFRSRETFADDLGILGAWIGPRTGPDKRTKGQKEDYVLRRLLAAWKQVGRLVFPVEIAASEDERGQPDFVLAWPNGETLGIEVTEGGAEHYQKWLTGMEEESETYGPAMYNEDGYVGDRPERQAAEDIRKAIERKTRAFDSGKYRLPDHCDLVVYDNSETGWFSDLGTIVGLVGRPNDLRGHFRQIHIVSGNNVCLDIFGTDFFRIDVSRAYEIDFAAWTSDQVKRMRQGKEGELDLTNIAEEIESLGKSERRTVRSHLRNLIVHLLKWKYQPKKRSASWLRSMANSRSEIEDAIADSPSLGTEDFLMGTLQDEYPKARKRACREAKLSPAAVPEECPFPLDRLFDQDYPPVGEKERQRS